MGTRFHYNAKGRYVGCSTDAISGGGPPIWLMLAGFAALGGGLVAWGYSWGVKPYLVEGKTDAELIEICHKRIESKYNDAFHYVSAGRVDGPMVVVRVDVDDVGPDKRDTPRYENKVVCTPNPRGIMTASDVLPL